MVDSVHEECGVFGIYDPIVSNVAQSTYFALYALQHRGQESCGIAVNEDGIFRSHRAVGLVPEVFTAQVLEKLGRGSIAVGMSGIPQPATSTSATPSRWWCAM